VASAERVLSAAWPLKTFVAVNPLGGVEHHPFEEAVRMAGDLLGLRGHLPLERFRALHAQGRINDADLLRDADCVVAPGFRVPGVVRVVTCSYSEASIARRNH
jgi:uncharacterized protein YbcC (UPF0753/DUF2309 family)